TYWASFSSPSYFLLFVNLFYWTGALVARENFPLERLTSSCHALKPLQATSERQVAEARLPGSARYPIAAEG
ncbi:hypothetical protein Q5692_23705, partial [Microcoleus sp. C2C3]|uniref:hypothetical protein n=1 Tax=unclassified Microcoleus TaxID=2642155 RepID=UPI002FD303E7